MFFPYWRKKKRLSAKDRKRDGVQVSNVQEQKDFSTKCIWILFVFMLSAGKSNAQNVLFLAFQPRFGLILS